MRNLMRWHNRPVEKGEFASPRHLPVAMVRRQEETGFSLIEVMVAFVVLMVVMVPLAYMLVAQVDSAAMSKQRLTAIGLAETWAETLSNSTPPASSLGGPNVQVPGPPTVSGSQIASQVVAGSTYSFTVEYAWDALNGAPDLCLSGIPQVLDLQIWVYWDGKRHVVTDNTLINYPTHGVQTLGFIAVQLTNSATVNDNNGNPYSTRVQSVPVTITTITTIPAQNPLPTPVVLYPDQNGCVFTEATPGTYTVSVANPTLGVPTGMSYGSPSFVANLANQPTAPSSTAITVATGQSSLVPYQYDEATPVSVNYAVNGSAYSPPSGLPLTISGVNLKPSNYWNIVPAGGAAAATSLPPSGAGLYPFSDGYSVFAGDCAAESTTPGVAHITTTPGVPTSVTVPLASVTIVVSVPNLPGIPVNLASASVNLVTFWPPNTGCPVDTYPFATTNSSGSTTAVVPFGSYNIVVTATVLGIPQSVTVPILVTNSGASFPVLLP
jgi:hypothetical protein